MKDGASLKHQNDLLDFLPEKCGKPEEESFAGGQAAMIAWVVSTRLLSYAIRYDNEIGQSGLEKHKNTIEKCDTFAPPVNGNSRYCPYFYIFSCSLGYDLTYDQLFL